MKKIIIPTVLISLIAMSMTFSEVRPIEGQLKYELNPQMVWEENEVEGLMDIVTSYTLEENENINMKFTFIDQDLSKAIIERPLNEIVEQLMRGKSSIYEMMDASNNKVIEKKLLKINNIPVMRLKTQYEIDETIYYLIENYYIVPNKILLTSFRWTSKDGNSYLKPLKDYENVHVRNDQ